MGLRMNGGRENLVPNDRYAHIKDLFYFPLINHRDAREVIETLQIG